MDRLSDCVVRRRPAPSRTKKRQLYRHRRSTFDGARQFSSALSGKKYVSGIVGSGVQENVDGSGSAVSWNYSLVDITDCQQYQGAISGSDTGTFEHNYYVSDDLPGINRQGYRAGRAHQLCRASRCPISPEHEVLHARLVADDKTVLSRAFQLRRLHRRKSDIPRAARQERLGSVHWTTPDLTNLHFDTVVTAVYEAYTPALPLNRRERADRLSSWSRATTTTATPSP